MQVKVNRGAVRDVKVNRLKVKRVRVKRVKVKRVKVIAEFDSFRLFDRCACMHV